MSAIKPSKKVKCLECNRKKMLFATEKEALDFIRFNQQEIYEENGFAPVRAYWCEACGGWHLTHRESYLEGPTLTQTVISAYRQGKANKRIVNKEIYASGVHQARRRAVEQFLAGVYGSRIMSVRYVGMWKKGFVFEFTKKGLYSQEDPSKYVWVDDSLNCFWVPKEDVEEIDQCLKVTLHMMGKKIFDDYQEDVRNMSFGEPLSEEDLYKFKIVTACTCSRFQHPVDKLKMYEYLEVAEMKGLKLKVGAAGKVEFLGQEVSVA